MLRLTLGIKGLMICTLWLACLPAVGQQTLPDGPAPKTQPQQGVPDAPQPKPRSQTNFLTMLRRRRKMRALNSRKPRRRQRPKPQRVTQPERHGQADEKICNRCAFSVNFVQVPVTVRDKAGKMISGLTSNDFKVYEDGVPQQLKFFTADAFPLSAAVVMATDLPSTTMKKVDETLPALISAFSEFDEVALYRYGHTVQQVSGFTAAPSVSTASVNRIKRPGRQGGPPMLGDLSEAVPPSTAIL